MQPRRSRARGSRMGRGCFMLAALGSLVEEGAEGFFVGFVGVELNEVDAVAAVELGELVEALGLLQEEGFADGWAGGVDEGLLVGFGVLPGDESGGGEGGFAAVVE